MWKLLNEVFIDFKKCFKRQATFQYIFITTAFDAYLLPGEEEFNIINGGVDDVLDMAESRENSSNKEAIPFVKQFAKEIDNLLLLSHCKYQKPFYWQKGFLIYDVEY
ncbi:hypothetical protein G9F71_010320 [Clostridium sp. FP2]|uniref:hypothetical protein n=1 Tax=Clostridium sp. FP2 TaxID=2724481 RepID=UPI0013E97799|nr:hypothetical protein [Clostridium sp. FP2]MBZ9623248.1 hypothetical protein [Clostridium sp. FP2]